MTVKCQGRSRQDKERYRHEGSMLAPQYLRVLRCIRSILLCSALEFTVVQCGCCCTALKLQSRCLRISSNLREYVFESRGAAEVQQGRWLDVVGAEPTQLDCLV